MTLDPATVSAAHAQAEQQRQTAPIGAQSRTYTGTDLDPVRASIARHTADTKARVHTIRCQCAAVDALLYAADEDSDLVSEALTDAGVEQ